MGEEKMIEDLRKAAARVGRISTTEAKRLKLTDSDGTKAVQKMAVGAIMLALENPDADETELTALFEGYLAANVQEQESVALTYHRARLDVTVRPAYEKAVKSGADPVPVVQAVCGMTEGAAREAVEELKAADTAKDTEQNTADNTDPFAVAAPEAEPASVNA